MEAWPPVTDSLGIFGDLAAKNLICGIVETFYGFKIYISLSIFAV